MVQRIAFTIRCPRIRAFDWLQEWQIPGHEKQWQTKRGLKRKPIKKGDAARRDILISWA
jgi:hypothetical protein